VTPGILAPSIGARGGTDRLAELVEPVRECSRAQRANAQDVQADTRSSRWIGARLGRRSSGAESPDSAAQYPENSMSQKLFEARVPEAQQNLAYRSMRERAVDTPARDELENVYAGFIDVDGDFVLKFQTDAFEARLFELFLFALFRDWGFHRDGTHSRPDLVLAREGVELSVEAVTANPSQGAPAAVQPPRIGEDFEALVSHILRSAAEKQRSITAGELRNRLSRPLRAKLSKAYWKLPHVQGRPLILAAQDFHAEGSLLLLTQPFAEFLYGDFFHEPDADHVSAVLVANTAASSKFGRMRLQRDPAVYPRIVMVRVGWHYQSQQPGTPLSVFNYTVGDSAWAETWAQGVTVFHNPAASQPADPSLFPGAKQYTWPQGVLEVLSPSFHPEASTTATLIGT
jgi:hypothetical protein